MSMTEERAGRPIDTTLDPVPDLLERAAALTPLLREHASSNEELGRLSDTTINALKSEGLLHFCAPREVGGLAVGTLGALRVFERLMAAEGSAGWVPMVNNICVTLLYYLEPDVARRFCQSGLPSIAGQGAPMGVAKPVSGGYRLTGEWSYGSGIHFADYVLASCVLHDSDGCPTVNSLGLPDARIFLVPIEEVTLGGNWDVLGLKATGSVDYSIADVFVPADTGIDILNDPVFGAPASAVEFSSWAMVAHTAAALGLGRRALDEAAEVLVRPKGPAGCAAQHEHIQIAFAKAEATMRSARAFAYEVWEDIETSIATEGSLSTRQRTLQRLVLLHTTHAAEEVATCAYRFGSGASLRDSPLQRAFRDMQSAAQHILVSEPFYRYCGEELLGISEERTWRLYGLL